MATQLPQELEGLDKLRLVLRRTATGMMSGLTRVSEEADGRLAVVSGGLTELLQDDAFLLLTRRAVAPEGGLSVLPNAVSGHSASIPLVTVFLRQLYPIR